MEPRASSTSRNFFRLAFIALCSAVLGWASIDAILADRDDFSLTEFCQGSSEQPRLACISEHQTDRSPMPPQG